MSARQWAGVACSAVVLAAAVAGVLVGNVHAPHGREKPAQRPPHMIS